MPYPNDATPSLPTRRTLLTAALTTAAATTIAQQSSAQNQPQPDPRRSSPKKYPDLKKSINQWAFPYPQRMNLEECLRLAKDD